MYFTGVMTYKTSVEEKFSLFEFVYWPLSFVPFHGYAGK